MRMTLEAFHTWSQHLQLSAETEALIATIRASPPVRRPSGHAGNITGRYPSPKMGVSIQFESDRVEFWAIFGMERDADVLKYYDQSSRIPLSYRAPSGHRTTHGTRLTSLSYAASPPGGKNGSPPTRSRPWP